MQASIERIEDLLLNNDSEDVCVIDNSGSYSYSDMKREILQLSSFLYPRLKNNNNVVFISPNDSKAIVGIFAIMHSGGTAVPLDVKTPERILNDIINQVEAKIVLYFNYSITDYLIQNNSGVSFVDLGSYVAQSTLIDAHKAISKNHDALILFTSGTSGSMKAVVHTHSSLLSNIEAINNYMRINKHDRFFIVKSYVHASSIVGEIFVALSQGASVCLFDPRVPIAVSLKRISTWKATIMGVNPTLLSLFCTQVKKLEMLSSIKLIICSGSILRSDLLNNGKKLLLGTCIINVYGLTEAGPRVCAQDPNIDHSDNSVGKPIHKTTVKIVNCTDNYGEILVKSPSLMRCYYNDIEETQKKITDGWLNTGDIGYFNVKGELVVLGRKDDLIIHDAHNIDPNRVENVILNILGVEQCIVFGRENSLNKTIIVAAIVRNSLLVERSLIINTCKESLFSYELPQEIIFVDSIPLTAENKKSRHLAREYFYGKK